MIPASAPMLIPELSTEILHQALDTCPVAVFVNRLEDPADDDSLLIVFANQAAGEQTNVRPADMIGLRCLDVFPALREGGFIDLICRVLRTGESESYENNMYEDELLVAAFAGRVERVGPDLAFNWCENVTRRKQAETEAARAEVLEQEAQRRSALMREIETAHRRVQDALETHELIASAAEEALWEIKIDDPDQPLSLATPCRFSDRFAELAGLEPAEVEPVVGMFLRVVHPDDLQRVAALFYGALEAPEGRFRAEYRLVTKSGDARVVQVAARVGRDSHGRPCKIAGAISDLTEQRRIDTELRERFALTERQQSLIEELSTPLLEVWDGVLALPIVGVFDERRAAIATDALLRAVVEKGIRFALIDLTGVEHLDTSTAHHVTRIAQALGLLGARTIITGIRSAVARAIVELNLDLSSLETRRTLRDALRECQRSLEREPPRNTRPG